MNPKAKEWHDWNGGTAPCIWKVGGWPLMMTCKQGMDSLSHRHVNSYCTKGHEPKMSCHPYTPKEDKDEIL